MNATVTLTAKKFCYLQNRVTAPKRWRFKSNSAFPPQSGSYTMLQVTAETRQKLQSELRVQSVGSILAFTGRENFGLPFVKSSLCHFSNSWVSAIQREFGSIFRVFIAGLGGSTLILRTLASNRSCFTALCAIIKLLLALLLDIMTTFPPNSCCLTTT